MSLLAVVVLLMAIAGGTAVVGWGDARAPFAAKIAGGVPVGLALLGLVGFLLGLAFGLTTVTVIVAAVLAAAPLALPGWVGSRRPPRRGRLWPRLLFWTIAVVVLSAVFDRVVLEQGGALGTGNDHNLGDLPFHLAIVTGFTQGGNWPPEHPELSGAKLTYPFLVDLVAALLVKVGASLRAAFFVENLSLALALVALLHRFGLRLTRDVRAAALTPLLVLLSGGLGFGMFFGEGGPFLERLLRLAHDYTITWTGELRWGNAIVTLLVPQRALLLGVPLAVLVWSLWWQAAVEPSQEDAARNQRAMVLAGLATGLLPLVHSHAFAICIGMGACLALLFPSRAAWTRYFVGACLLGLPQVAWMAYGSSLRTREFLGWQVGWDRGEQNPIAFWLTNTGLLLPLLAAGLIGGRATHRVRFLLPFQLLFVLPNLFRLSPWIWDNIKFLFFWFLASAPLVALVVARRMRGGWGGRAVAAAAAVVLTLSGGLDVWRMASRQMTHWIFPPPATRFAVALQVATPPRALVLHLPTYDSPVYLTGRRSLLGYPGHIGSQGLDAEARDEEVRRIYAGAPDALDLIRRRGVGYLVVGPQERAHLVVNDAFLARWPVLLEAGGHRLYRVGGG